MLSQSQNQGVRRQVSFSGDASVEFVSVVIWYVDRIQFHVVVGLFPCQHGVFPCL